MNALRAHAIGALALGLIATTSSISLACPACPGSLDQMLGDAELVFRGTVTDITYRMSEPGGPEDTAIPFTFVTYEVADVFYGAIDGATVTLRFEGGWDSNAELFLHVSGSPLFDKGDHDILFIAGNNQRGTPLAGGTNGRLRVIDGRIFGESGREVLLHGDRSFRFGHRYFSPDVFTTTIGDGIMTLTMDTDENDLHFGPSRAISERQAIRNIRMLAGEMAQPLNVFVNADPTLSIPAPDMRPAPMPAAKAIDFEQGQAVDAELQADLAREGAAARSETTGN